MSKKDFWVVGVGASAGGLEALSTFFKNLPEKPQAAFVVAQHLAPHAKSMMVELLARQTNMPVMPVKDRIKLEPSTIYIVPPNFDVKVADTELRLLKAGEETRPKPSVDLLFSTLAESHGTDAVGIILSGTGSDGSDGIRAIKEAGGVTIVQDAESAKYDGMPKSAFETGLIDAVLPPEKIAVQLFSILEHRSAIPPEKTFSEGEQSDFAKIISYLKEQVGSDFTQYKISTIQRRLEKRLATVGVNSLPEYLKLLKKNPSELAALSQNMLVSVTAFFRDNEAYDALSKRIEEIISKKNTGDEVRIWSAGCATGEEPYSLAMIVTDLCEKHRKQLSVKIFATDLDQDALGTARLGQYTTEDVSGVPEEFLSKYFERKDKVFEVRKSLRDVIVFARQDLIQNPPFVKLDLVTCRNVLIYFEGTLQNRVFEIFHYSLRPGGFLFLGKSESANSALFEAIDKKEKLYRRLNVVTSIVPRHQAKYRPGDAVINPQSMKKDPTPADTLALAAPIQLMKMLNVSGVVIDEDSNILHTIGDVGDYVQFPVGKADFRLTNLLPKSIALEFSVLMKKAQKEEKLIRGRPLRLEPGMKKMFSFSIMPMEKNPLSRATYIVGFEPKKGVVDEVHITPSTDGAQRLVELEQELTATKENLQTLIEELEISNEELQSLNEELSSTNEELQASNEELETTNEELQSTNEELMTLNEELSIKSTELRMAYTNLDNIQSSIGVPLLVLDYDLRLIRYNSASLAVFNLGPQDVQRPITKASSLCEIPDFEKLLKNTVETGKINEIVCQTPKQIFQLRIHPSRDESRRVIGAILFFFDNTEFIHARENVEVSEKRIRSIIDNSPTMITLKDNVGKYLSVNQAFLDFYKMKFEDVIGKTDRDIFDEEHANEIRDNDLEVLLKRQQSTRQEEFEYNGKKNYFHVNRFPLFGKNDRNPYAVGSVSLDISQELQTKELREEMKHAEAANRAKSEFLASMSHELRTPLNVIMGMSQLLNRGTLTEHQKKLIESIQRSSKVLLSLIEDVLDLSKIEAGKINFEKNPIKLEQLTTDAFQGFESEASRKGIQLFRDSRLDHDLTVLGDQVRLRQVLNNLLGNALKFTEKGSVHFLVRQESKTNDHAIVYFEVKDSGIGIPKESQAKLFQRFTQADSSTSRRFGGTGLGLAISKQLVELMDGNIGFDSVDGIGSTFWFRVRFPLADGSAENQEDNKDTDLDMKSLRILAVDDNPESLRFLRLFFEDGGATIVTAESGQDAIHALEKEDFNVILMDMQMPKMDGLETTRRIRKLNSSRKRIPVIALTANAMPGDREICLKAGMNDYLTKPVDLNELRKLLRKWI